MDCDRQAFNSLSTFELIKPGLFHFNDFVFFENLFFTPIFIRSRKRDLDLTTITVFVYPISPDLTPISKSKALYLLDVLACIFERYSHALDLESCILSAWSPYNWVPFLCCKYEINFSVFILTYCDFTNRE